MEKQNAIFLFGAGSVMDWGGPQTRQLTDAIRSVGFTIQGSSQKLTDHIHQTLIENGYDESEVNFETIINVIEELSIYFSEFNPKNRTPSLLRAFIRGEEMENVFDFAIKGGVRKHGYTLEIPAGREYVYSNYALNNENPHQFYLQHLLSGILTEISAHVSEYAYHTNSHSVVDIESSASVDFKKWMRQLQDDHALRLYTLNYDRIFKVLLGSAEIDCFEGFYPTGEATDLKGLRCDLKRIIEDSKGNVHYNLHGSAFWKVVPANSSQLPSPEIVYTGIPHLQLNDEMANLQVEKGKPMYLTNIITGYQKAQKSMLSPFKQMQFSFERDCLNTGKIHIIGYSFGDEHIDQCLKTALRYNPDLGLEIVDPNFIKNDMDHQLSITLFQYFETGFIAPTKVGDNKFSYFGGRVTVYTLKFNEYLKARADGMLG